MSDNYEQKYLEADQRAISLRVDLQRSQKLLEDAQNEISRLRALVREAYEEGYVSGSGEDPGFSFDYSTSRRRLGNRSGEQGWDHSQSRRRMTEGGQ